MRRPSAGCLLLGIVTASTAAFLLWGAREPDLDRVWRLLREMKIGRIQRVDEGDMDLLRQTVRAHPDLAPSLLDDQPAGILSAHANGWIETDRAYLMVQPDLESDPRVSIRCHLPEGAYPARVILSGPESTGEVSFAGPGARSVSLGQDLRSGGVIEAKLVARGEESMSGGIRILFPEEP